MSMMGPGEGPFTSNDGVGIPLVTGILVVAEDERINLARSAVTSFLRQTYPNFETVIINAAPTKAVLNDAWDSLREYKVDPVQYPTIGALRNKAIEEARGEWILPFDDDDHNHLHRLFIQMAARREGCCVALSDQVRVDIDRNMLCVFSNPKGLASTVLFPRTKADGSLNLYDPDMLEAGEDDEFLERNFGESKTIALPTSGEWFPGPCTSIAYYHTRNKSSRERFFGRYAAPSYENRVASDIPEDHMEYIRNAMERAGLSASVKASGFSGPAGS